MKINITVGTFKKLKKQVKGHFWHAESNGNIDELDNETKVKVSIADLDHDSLPEILEILKDQNEHAQHIVSRIAKGLEDPVNTKIVNAFYIPDMLKAYLAKHKNPVLFDMVDTAKGATYLPTECYYTPADVSRGRSERVELYLAYVLHGRLCSRNVNLASGVGSTIPEVLTSHGLCIPNKELEANLVKIMDRFNRYLTMNTLQFKARGFCTERSRSYDWWKTDNTNLTVGDKPSNVVLDLYDSQEDEDETRPAFVSKLNRTTASSIYKKDNLPVPIHPVVPVFSLRYHKDVWVNVCNLVPYKYDTTLYDKLVLPKSHRRLIAALVSNLDMLRETTEEVPNKRKRSEILSAKAQSSVILAQGPAGTGKTLTAEVYAERIERPLYEIQSGQIGTNAGNIEENLQSILLRASRLKMPLLINEADVFVKERGDDLEQNAVVAVFLRLLEYHNGLVFLTTNRSNDIDQAILSRCIAQIQYAYPDEVGREALWRITLDEYELSLTDKEIKAAISVFPEIVGRDIQNLVRLTTRVCNATKTEFNLQALVDNAVFRNIKISDKVLK